MTWDQLQPLHSDWEVDLRPVHLDEGHEVSVEPLHGELEVVGWRGEKVESPSAVQIFQSQQVLRKSPSLNSCPTLHTPAYLRPYVTVIEVIGHLVLVVFVETKPLEL